MFPLPSPGLDTVVHIHPVPGPGDAGGARLQDVAVGEQPAVALVRIPGPELAPGGHRTSVLTSWWSLRAHDGHAHLTLAYWQVLQWVNHVLIHDDVTSLVLDIVTEVCCCGCCCSGGGGCWWRGRPVTWWPCVWRRRGTSHAALVKEVIDSISRYLLPHNLHNIHRNLDWNIVHRRM